MKKFLYTFSRIFIGLVFTFSGFVKAVDPMGTSIKFSDYFNYAFNLPHLAPLSLPLALLLCATEFSIGILLLFNLLPKLATWLAVFLMLIFTPLTFYLAIANPVRDCGCFGDAVKLTNWQTFGKNVIIDFFLVILFIRRNDFSPRLRKKFQQIFATIAILLIFGFELYNYSYLPVIDFRPYKIGNNIKQMMTIPKDAPKDVFKTTFVYKNKKTGEVKEFTEKNYPWQDSNWVWQQTKSVLVKQGYVPPIHDFKLVDMKGNDMTDSLLNNPDTSILVVTYMLEDANFKNLVKVKNFVDSFVAFRPKTKVFFVTSSNDDVINKYADSLKIDNWKICKIDEVTSKTIIRSNPGVVFLKKAVILDKLHFHSLNTRHLAKLLGMRLKDFRKKVKKTAL
jgi:uncharacterized membrane protein YphA (DoxX/SURF4 family)